MFLIIYNYNHTTLTHFDGTRTQTTDQDARLQVTPARQPPSSK